MVPKTGIIWKCVAQCATMCSASSILPRPVGPSITTMPPSAKGLPGGAFVLDDAVLGMVCSLRWMVLLKLPPNISCTLTMPAHLFTLHSCCTFDLHEDTTSLAVTTEPSMGLSYHGKRIFFSRVRPICAIASLGCGLNTGIGSGLPLILMDGSRLYRTSPVVCLLVSSSQRMPCSCALYISRAERLTESPKTVYSMRLALPQTPQ
mmetsp:Transcript_15439/g.48693  ORF Transcript_15439/g.48693 Transcript_15439/m.48693 type:complete len:205 (+) Transcript_15439:1311-1925(+)